MNLVTMSGRLTKDPEIRYTTGQNSIAVASFSIAVERRFKKEGGPEADFFSCTAFGKTAEHMEKYWKKGMKAMISGRIENEAWQDKDGQKRTSTKILIDQIEFCEKKQQTEAKPVDDGAGAYDFRPTAADEDLPFKF